MNQENINSNQPCYFFEFGLFVTGETEEQHLQDLFNFDGNWYMYI